MIYVLHSLLLFHARLRGVICIFALLSYLSASAVLAQEYPVSGVWVAADGRTPGSKGGACFALKLLGVDAAMDGTLPAVLIFADGKRVELHAGYRSDASLKSVTGLADDAFRISETPRNRSKWFPWVRKQSHSLRMVDPVTIEFSQGSASTRFVKCSPKSSIL